MKKKVQTIKQKIKIIVDAFKKAGWKPMEMERCLDLEFGTLENSEDPALLPLLKILAVYPWLIRVAEKNYDTIEAKRIMTHAAIDTLFDQFKEKK